MLRSPNTTNTTIPHSFYMTKMLSCSGIWSIFFVVFLYSTNRVTCLKVLKGCNTINDNK